jgi:hypothetical protein
MALGAVSPAIAADLYSNLQAYGQVREGDLNRETEAPTQFYGDLGASNFWHGATLDSVFRLGRDLAVDDGQSDFYAGYAKIPAHGAELTAGRQLVDEGPGAFVIADAGKLRLDRGGPVALTVFGGAPHYFDRIYGPAKISDNETLWGANLRSHRWHGGVYGLGFTQWERDGHMLQQLISATVNQSLLHLPGSPDLYGSFAWDADHQNLDRGMGGVNFLGPLRTMINFEGTYYKPQDQRNGELQQNIDFREDSVFELFSLSELVQLRTGLHVPLSKTVSAFGDYSYQQYKPIQGRAENGHVGSAGIMWLPGGDGLEVVRLEYFLLDSRGGNVNGASLYYENQVYDRIIFRTKLGIAGYDQENNQNDVPVSTFLGLGYEILPGLVGELSMEANRNDRFNSDFRFGFLISYTGRHRIPPGKSGEPKKGAEEGAS